MNKKDFNHSKITKIEPYQNADGSWLFNLTYELWDDDGNVAELNVPCVESPFYGCADLIHLHEHRDEQRACDKLGNVVCRFDNVYYTADMKTLGKVDIYAANDNDESLDYSYFYTVKTIKKKMTINDIEKALGYKVEIVDEEN